MNAALRVAHEMTATRDQLIARAARILEHANGRQLTRPEAAALEMLLAEASTYDNRASRFWRVSQEHRYSARPAARFF